MDNKPWDIYPMVFADKAKCFLSMDLVQSSTS